MKKKPCNYCGRKKKTLIACANLTSICKKCLDGPYIQVIAA